MRESKDGPSCRGSVVSLKAWLRSVLLGKETLVTKVSDLSVLQGFKSGFWVAWLSQAEGHVACLKEKGSDGWGTLKCAASVKQQAELRSDWPIPDSDRAGHGEYVSKHKTWLEILPCLMHLQEPLCLDYLAHKVWEALHSSKIMMFKAEKKNTDIVWKF